MDSILAQLTEINNKLKTIKVDGIKTIIKSVVEEPFIGYQEQNWEENRSRGHLINTRKLQISKTKRSAIERNQRLWWSVNSHVQLVAGKWSSAKSKIKMNNILEKTTLSCMEFVKTKEKNS